MRPCLVGLVSVVAALIVLPPPAQAQTVSLGVYGGFTSSDFLGYRSSTWPENRITFGGGVFLPIRLLPFLTFEPGISWVRKGARRSELLGDTGLPRQSHLAFSYLEFPILFRFNLPTLQHARWKPTVFLGPSLGFMLSCEWPTSGPSGGRLDGATENCQIDHCARLAEGKTGPVGCQLYLGPFDNTRQLDIGGVVGLGLARTLGRTTLHLDARYGLGILGVDGNSPEFRNRAIGLNVGVSYALQR